MKLAPRVDGCVLQGGVARDGIDYSAVLTGRTTQRSCDGGSGIEEHTIRIHAAAELVGETSAALLEVWDASTCRDSFCERDGIGFERQYHTSACCTEERNEGGCHSASTEEHTWRREAAVDFEEEVV
jgi:hypothetical protein